MNTLLLIALLTVLANIATASASASASASTGASSANANTNANANANAKVALIIIDYQNCFLPTGTLPVPQDSLASRLNQLKRLHFFDVVVLSKDWHCEKHVSFASTHKKEPFSKIQLRYTSDGYLCKDELQYEGENAVDCKEYPLKHPDISIIELDQVLWPDHCIANTNDAELSPELVIDPKDIIVTKGEKCHIDSYSAFADNAHLRNTTLLNTLREHNVGSVYLAGLALDYCVYFTALDARASGMRTFVIQDATGSIDHDVDLRAKMDHLQVQGIHLIGIANIIDTEMFA